MSANQKPFENVGADWWKPRKTRVCVTQYKTRIFARVACISPEFSKNLIRALIEREVV